MATPVSSFAGGAKKSNFAAKSSFAKAAPAQADAWGPVLSFGQTLIDIISTPLYAVEGGIAASQKGKNPIVGAAENAVSWTQGKRPATGSDILKNAGMSNDFWSSLAADIALDPLTYTPGVAISAPIKAVLAGTKYGLVGSSAVLKGAISPIAAKITKTKVGEPAAAIVKPPLIEKAKITNDAAYQRTLQAEQKMQKFTYQPVQAAGERNVSQALAQMLASGLEAGYKGAAMSWEKSFLKYSTDKINRQTSKAIRNKVGVAAPKFLDDVIEDVQKTVDNAPEVDTIPAQVVTDAANAARIENIPVIDQAPIKVTPLEMVTTQKPVGKATAKDLKSNLDKIDKLVRGIKATAVGKEKAAKRVGILLGSERQNIYKFFVEKVGADNTIVKNMDLAARLKETNPLAVLRQYAESADPVRQGIVKALATTRVATKNGQPVLVRDLLTNAEYAGDFASQSADIRTKLLELFGTFTGIARNGNKAVFDVNKKAIEELLGEDVAFQIQKTGALDPATKTDVAALKAIIASLPEAQEKTYKNFNDFIDGIKSQDIIEKDALERVLRLVNPEHRALTEIDKAIDSGRSTEVLKTALLTAGVATMRTVRTNLLNLDPETFMKSTDIALSDVAFATTNEILRGVQEIDLAATAASREAAGASLVQKREAGLGSFIDDAADSIGRGLTTRMGELYTSVEGGISRLGQMYSRAYRADGSTEAYLNKLFNQYVETDVLGSMFGKMTFRRGAKEAAAARKGIEYTPRSMKQVEAEFILRTSTVDEIALATFGVRIVHVRSVKKTKGKKSEAYHHYVNIGDTARVFKKGDSDLFMKLVVPSVSNPGAKLVKTDSLSFQTIGDAISDVLRDLEKGTGVDPQALVKALKTPPPGKTWSADFRAIVDANVEDFVKFIVDPKNANEFADIHKAKLKSEIIDSVEPAQRFSSAMVDSMLNAYSAMRDKNVTSQLEKDKIVHDWMLKFAAIADIFAFSNGQVAREVFRSTARIFFELGTPVKGTAATEFREKIAEFARANPNNSDVYEDFMKTLESYYKWEPSVSSQIPNMNKDVIDAAQKAWVVAKDDFQKSVEKLTTDMTPQQVADWRKTHDELFTALKASRKQMGKAGLDTDYWNGQTWVSADRYSRKAALKSLEKMPNRYIYTKSGIIDIARYMVDGTVEVPTFKRYGIRHTAETRKIFEDIAAERRTLIAKSDKADAQEAVLDKLDEFEKMTPDNPEAVVERANEELFILRNDEGRAKVELETPDKAPVFLVEGRYKTATQEEGMTGLRLAGQKLQGGAGFRKLAPLLASAESSAHNAIADTADVMRSAFSLFRKAGLKTENMDTALNAAVNKAVLSADEVGAATAELGKILGKVWDSTTQHVRNRGLHPKYLEQAFKMQGIDKFIPDWGIFKSADDIDRILGWLPIGDPPSYLQEGLDSADELLKNQARIGIDQYDQAKAAWIAELAKREDSVGSIAMFHKAIAAIQHASSEATLASMIVEDFNFMQYYPGMSKEAARKAALATGEFVEVKSSSAGHSLLKWFPAKDNLFPKDIAKQIGALERHYNYTMENNMGKFVRNSMTLLGIFKTTQTVLRPGHLVNTTVGDTITSLMRGTNPLLFKPSTRLVMKFAGDKIDADWKASEGGKRMALLEQSLAGLYRREIAEAQSGMVFDIGGRKTISDEDMITILRDSGALRTNVAANDEMLQMAELQSFQTGSDQTTSYNKMMLEKMTVKNAGANAKRYWLTATKPAGDAVAYAGNIPRVATALDVLKKGSFKNREEAVRAITEELTTYHPMIESLSAWERQKVRPLFSYYTWLKGAHYAMLKMALEHTAAMTIPSKVFYNQALANQMGPGSIGNLWGDKEETPNYLNYSTYGPTSQGPRGGIVYRPSVLPLDVLDTWNLQFDATKSVDKQTFDNLKNVGQNVIGKNINMVFQPAIEFVTGTDPSTGKPSTVKDIQTAGDSLLSNIGTMQLFQALGVYTPPNKGPESKNPITDRDRFLKGLNFGVGMRISDVDTTSNIKNARTDQSARLKRIQEKLLEQGQ